MNKTEAIELLVNEGWTKADAIRALEGIDFGTNPDELGIRRAISPFSGSELNKRQRLQAAQKGMVTKKDKEIEQINQDNSSLKAHIGTLTLNKNKLLAANENLAKDNKKLIEINEELKKDNKNLKNLVDRIKLKLAQDTKQLLQYEDSEIRKALIKLFNSTLG